MHLFTYCYLLDMTNYLHIRLEQQPVFAKNQYSLIASTLTLTLSAHAPQQHAPVLPADISNTAARARITRKITRIVLILL
jgi:hypothetical protein